MVAIPKRAGNWLGSMLGGAPPVPSSLAGRTVAPSYGAPAKVAGIDPRNFVPASHSAAGWSPTQATRPSINMPATTRIQQPYSINMPNSPGPLPPSPVSMNISSAPIGPASARVPYSNKGNLVGSARLNDKIKMPGPSINKPKSSNMTVAANPIATSGGSLGSAIGSGMMAVGSGAMIGGGMSYLTGGSFIQGAMVGGIMGGGMYGGHKALGTSGVGGYSPQVQSLISGSENVAARRAMFGAGAMLGGGMFGGNRSHRTGFNSRRGNSIGR